jgi:acetyl-CoA decarbonylase/synthase complex subunit epsilon
VEGRQDYKHSNSSAEANQAEEGVKMAKAEPWQTAEIPGPKKANVITKPALVVAIIKKAKSPIFVVGHRAVEIGLGEKKVIDLAIDLAKAAEIPVVATAHIVGEFTKRGFNPAAWMPAMDIGNRLKDSEWDGVDSEGQHDLALFMGMPYYMEWLILSGLKHFAYKHLTTISVDRFYQPHATWSFPNMEIEEWTKNLEDITNMLRGK